MNADVQTSQAVVLARGLGRRMREGEGAALTAAQAAAASAGMKAMMPVASGRPFLDYVLHALAEAGVRRVGLVLGPEHDAVRDYYRQQTRRRLEVSCLVQPEALGTADAVVCAEPWTERQPFLVANADNMYPVPVLKALVEGTTPAFPGFERDSLGLPLEKIGTYALVERDARGCLSRITEKPGVDAVTAAGPAALISMNVWRFDRRIFEACRDVPVSSRGERELPQAVGLAAARGMCLEVIPVQGTVVDLSRRADVADVERALAGAVVEL
jgi:glucose-1-phosphate thymidylyltransferase